MNSFFREQIIFLVTIFLTLFLFCGCQDDDGDSGGDDSASDDTTDEAVPSETALHDFRLRSSDGLADGGLTISLPGYDTADWNAVHVPATVLAGLIAAGVYPDPYYGMNLHELPGSMPMGMDVQLFPMPPGSPFRFSWWYRTEFIAPRLDAGERAWLRFEGINFRANVWLNGRLIADKNEVAGTFREYEFDVTDVVKTGATNALAFEVFAPTPFDLAYNWVDWGPGPPDKNMGIYRDVKLVVTGPVRMRFPLVVPTLDLPEMKSADLTISAELYNESGLHHSGTLSGSIEGVTFSKDVVLEPHSHQRVTFAPANYPRLTVENPRVWWPRNLGAQEIYQLDLEFTQDGIVSDRQSVTFGIRDVQAPLSEEGYRYFVINGRKMLMRGAAWSSDLLLRFDPERAENEIRYAADMGINMIRSEGKPEPDVFYDMLDRYGILYMAGWCCCDHWQYPETWNAEDHAVAAESLRNQIHHLRNHPSMTVWLNGSDDPPTPDVEQMYIDILTEEGFPEPYLSSADDQDSQITGPSGVKMVGPYDYVPPEYWLADTEYGGAFGFNTETCPGEVIPHIEDLERFIPAEHLWPIDIYWIYHAGRGWYLTLYPFNKAMKLRYTAAEDVNDYIRKAQALDYDGHRAMFEAYGRNKYHATGVIQFLMNSPWPSLIWNLYDFYLHPAGAYFGAKKALEMLHVQYSYDDRTIVVVNSYSEAYPELTVTASVLDFDLSEKFHQEQTVSVESDGVASAFTLPEFSDISTTYFLKLELTDASDELVSRNFYWLSTQPVVFDWSGTFSERLSPVTQEADMTLLDTLPPATLDAEVFSETDEEKGWERRSVHVENNGAALAFLTRLRLVNAESGEDVAPVLWEDNYFPLFPGESRDVNVRFRTADLGGDAAGVELSGWNTEAARVE